MGQVYSRAESVVAWLGQPTKNTDHVMDHISRLKDPDLVYPDAAGLGTIEQAFAAIRDSAVHFFHLSWWSRLWTVQEVNLARAVVFMCGSRTVTSQDLDFWCSRGYFGMDLGGLWWTGFDRLLLRRSRSLFDLLMLHSRLHCMKPHDRVYSLLGIAENGGTFPVPDYTASLFEVYSAVALRICARDGNLNFLLASGISPLGEGKEQGLPSWVPGWTQTSQSFIWGWAGCTTWPSSAKDNGPEFQLLNDGRIFKTLGVPCDVVSEVESNQALGGGQPLGWRHLLPSASPADYKAGISQLLAYLQVVHMGVGVDLDRRIGDIESVAFKKTLTGFLYGLGQPEAAGVSGIKTRESGDLVDSFLWWIGDDRAGRTGEDILGTLLGGEGARGYLQWLSGPTRKGIETVSIAYSKGRKFLQRWAPNAIFTTRGGLLGNGHLEVQEGDVVYVIPYCRAPIVLRPVAGRDEHMVVGAAFVLGLMNGEVRRELEQG